MRPNPGALAHTPARPPALLPVTRATRRAASDSDHPGLPLDALPLLTYSFWLAAGNPALEFRLYSLVSERRASRAPQCPVSRQRPRVTRAGPLPLLPCGQAAPLTGRAVGLRVPLGLSAGFSHDLNFEDPVFTRGVPETPLWFRVRARGPPFSARLPAVRFVCKQVQAPVLGDAVPAPGETHCLWRETSPPSEKRVEL